MWPRFGRPASVLGRLLHAHAYAYADAERAGNLYMTVNTL